MNSDDLNMLLTHFTLTAKSKSAPENTEDAKLRRFKDKWLFIATLIILFIVLATCILFLIFNRDSPQAGVALSSAASIASALAGYYVRGARN